MKRTIRVILPTLIAVALVILTLLIRIPSEVSITFDSRNLCFYVSQIIDETDSLEVSIPLDELNVHRVEVQYFDYVLLERYDLYIYTEKPDSLMRIRSNSTFKITPIKGINETFSSIAFEAPTDSTLSIQPLQMAKHSRLRMQFLVDDRISVQVTEPLDSEHRPTFEILPIGHIGIIVEGCSLVESGERIIKKIPTGTRSRFLIQPIDQFSGISVQGEERRIRLDISYPVRELTDFSKVEMYDPSEDEWRTNLSPIPTPRKHAVTAVVNDRIYVIGGDETKEPLQFLTDAKAERITRDEFTNEIDVQNLFIGYKASDLENVRFPSALLDIHKSPYHISSIVIEKNKFTCSIHGSSGGAVLDNRIEKISLSPRLLEWFYKKQFLATVLGAIVWLVSTIYFLIKEWKSST